MVTVVGLHVCIQVQQIELILASLSSKLGRLLHIEMQNRLHMLMLNGGRIDPVKTQSLVHMCEIAVCMLVG